jgi:hypothetical protein
METFYFIMFSANRFFSNCWRKPMLLVLVLTVSWIIGAGVQAQELHRQLHTPTSRGSSEGIESIALTLGKTAFKLYLKTSLLLVDPQRKILGSTLILSSDTAQTISTSGIFSLTRIMFHCPVVSSSPQWPLLGIFF